MHKLPFSIFRRGRRRFYYVAFKNQLTGDYLPAISTKQETEAGAIQNRSEGSRTETVPLKKYSLRDMAKEADLTLGDAEYICRELKKRGLLRDFILPETKKAIPFAEYLLNFWDWEKSEYPGKTAEKPRHTPSVYYRNAE